MGKRKREGVEGGRDRKSHLFDGCRRSTRTRNLGHGLGDFIFPLQLRDKTAASELFKAF